MQTPWVMVHEKGHLADVPWHYLAHRNAGQDVPPKNECQRDWDEPYLEIRTVGSRHQIHCTRCKRDKAQLWREDQDVPFGNLTWRQPWVLEPPPQGLDKAARILAINDVQVHYANLGRVLTLPPESTLRRKSVVDRLYRSRRTLRQLTHPRNPLHYSSTLHRVAADFRCSPHDVEAACDEIKAGYPRVSSPNSPPAPDESEYRALTTSDHRASDDEELVTSDLTEQWRALAASLDGEMGTAAMVVDQLVEVRRLREIVVFKGFQRLSGQVVKPDLTSQPDWLPAVEFYGEGIFFTVDEQRLRQWETNDAVRDRCRIVADRFSAGLVPLIPSPQVSPRFLALHTLAHLLIHQLESSAGYAAASLRERVYARAAIGDEFPMAGVLIYVAVPDKEGSLGGLSLQADPKRFLRLLKAATEAAQWCSLDPVCAEQDGKGPGLLNRAACHACAMVPEPSCAYKNVLLDRTFVVGDAAGRTIGLTNQLGAGTK